MDEQGTPIPDAQLRWEGVLHHKEHVHYDYYHQDGPTGTLVVENHGENTHLELCLIATADDGAEGRACVDVYPGGEETVDSGQTGGGSRSRQSRPLEPAEQICSRS